MDPFTASIVLPFPGRDRAGVIQLPFRFGFFRVYDTLDHNVGDVICQNVFQSGCAALRFRHQCTSVPAAPYPWSVFLILAILVGVRCSLSSNGDIYHCQFAFS